MSLFGSKSNSLFDNMLNKATSHLNLETDWAAVLNLCDLIRQQDVTAQYAVNAVRRKLTSENPHTVFYALQTVESMVKNCGTGVYDEVLTTDFLDMMKELAKQQDPVREKVLELIQIWASVFSSTSRYRCIQDTFASMKREGYSFPQIKTSDAMFEAEAAPEWKEGTLCYKCRAQFTTFRRKHHCRSCGNIFCDECSDKRSIIPRFGIEKEVRVCKACFDDINSLAAPKPTFEFLDLAAIQSNNQSKNFFFSRKSKKNRDRANSVDTGRVDEKSSESEAAKLSKDKERELELREKEELELALALSASEAESKANQRSKPRQQASVAPSASSAPQHGGGGGGGGGLYSKLDTSGMDPELIGYLDRNYWEKRRREGLAESGGGSASKASVVAATAPAASATVAEATAQDGLQRGSAGHLNGEAHGLSKEEEASQREEFMRAMSSSIEIFVNRMKADSVRGRSIAADGTVQALFMTLNQMHPQLIEHMGQVEARRNGMEEQQDKLARLRDAREALNALREEHEDRRRAEQQERERQRYAQMMQKLEVMRQKKHELMEYQRQLAMQRMQEQEREYQMRLEAQKQRLAMEQYRQQFPYSSGAYQQQYMPQQQQQQVSDQSQLQQLQQQAPGYSIQYPPGYPAQPPSQQPPPPQPQQQQQQYYSPQHMPQQQQQQQQLPAASYILHQSQSMQPPAPDAMYSAAPMSLQQQPPPAYSSYQQPQAPQPSDPYAMQSVAHSLPPPQQQHQQHHQFPDPRQQQQPQQPQQQPQQQQQSDEAQLIQF